MCEIKGHIIMRIIIFVTMDVIVRLIVTKKIVQNSIRN